MRQKMPASRENFGKKFLSLEEKKIQRRHNHSWDRRNGKKCVSENREAILKGVVRHGK